LPTQYTNDSKPWPIQIEDHEGTLHSVNLEPGQMLFYESAKCLHGRMQVLDGKYYGRSAPTPTPTPAPTPLALCGFIRPITPHHIP